MEWVKTKDQLPKEYNQRCFFYAWGDTAMIGTYKGIHEGQGKFLCDHDNNWYEVTEDDITHWMPLPEPPKE